MKYYLATHIVITFRFWRPKVGRDPKVGRNPPAENHCFKVPFSPRCQVKKLPNFLKVLTVLPYFTSAFPIVFWLVKIDERLHDGDLVFLIVGLLAKAFEADLLREVGSLLKMLNFSLVPFLQILTSAPIRRFMVSKVLTN